VGNAVVSIEGDLQVVAHSPDVAVAPQHREVVPERLLVEAEFPTHLVGRDGAPLFDIAVDVLPIPVLDGDVL